jgi:hypothetical protein
MFVGTLFLSTLFALGIKGDSANKAELARLKGEYEAVLKVMTLNGC